MKKFYSGPISEGTPFDNENSNFTIEADNVQTALEEAILGGYQFNKIDAGVFLTDRIFQVSNLTSGQTINQNQSTVILDNVQPNSDTTAFIASSGEVESFIEEKIRVDFSITMDNTNTARTSSLSFLEVNYGSGWEKVENTEVYTYERTTAADRQTGTGYAIIDIKVGDKLRIRSQRIAGSNNTIIDEGCNLLITPLRPKTVESNLGIDGSDLEQEKVIGEINAGEL